MPISFQEASEQPMQPDTSPDWIPSQMREDASLIQWELEIVETMEEFKHTLRGEVLEKKKSPDNPDKIIEEWVVKGDIICNELGVTSLINLIKSEANKNLFLSNFNDDDILLHCKTVNMNAVNLIFSNYERWAFKTEYATSTVDICWQIVHAASKRAFGAMERKTLREMHKETVTTLHQPDLQKKGWWPF